MAATSASTAGPSGDAAAAPAAIESKEPQPGQAPHRGRGRHRTPRDRQFNREDRGRPSGDRRTSEKRGDRAQEQRGKRDERRLKGGRRERDRDDSRRKPEPKIYRHEAIVDRGFQDVPDPATEGATRRVDWTIVKRTTADQRSARTLSAIYVLQRDGVDTEFPHLSAARAAVDKSISHPEKLTRSKADHVAARGGGKK